MVGHDDKTVPPSTYHMDQHVIEVVRHGSAPSQVPVGGCGFLA
jgi:hypothetical protein